MNEKKILTKSEFDLLFGSAIFKYKVFRSDESAREVAELALKMLNNEVINVKIEENPNEPRL